MRNKSEHFSSDIETFIGTFVSDISDGTAGVFAGAGLSVASGYVNWAELMREIAAELGLDVDRETNLVAIAQYHLNERRNRSRINQKIIDEFSQGHALNENHKILARLPIDTFWTTNYDRMIETALEESGKIVDIKSTVEHLKKTRRGKHATLYKMHGDVGDADKAVLTKDDYEGYFRDHEPFVTALTGDLVSKTMLFIGFSFTDPNIDYVMSRIRVVLRSQPKQHYCILRRESRRAKEKIGSFEYRRRQQEYFVKDLGRVGIHALMVDEYSDITRILRAIEWGYRSRSIFVSGSAHEFDPWRPDEAGKFIEALSARLVRAGLNVVTGFGLGVGPSVIAGALQEVMRHPTSRSESQLQAFPFPVDDGTNPAGRALYHQHRERMIAKAGIAIFLFGNKRDKRGNVIAADGMRDEFAIAQELGLQTISVGSTGYVAMEIAQQVLPTIAGRSKSYQKAFKVACDPYSHVDKIEDAVMTMVNELRKQH